MRPMQPVESDRHPELPRNDAMCHFRTHAPRQRASSLDHLVGKGEQLVGHCKAERLCGLEVDHQLELDWGLDRQLARALALKNAINIGRHTPIVINQVNPVGK